MPRLWTLFLLLIASSLVMAAAVHARAIPGPVVIECTGIVHADGDTDQTQSDTDKSTPHHHGTCHGPALSLPATGGLKALLTSGAMLPFAGAQSATASHRVDPALRPPSA